MDERKQQEVRLNAKKILDDFGKMLESVKLKGGKSKIAVGGFRDEEKIAGKYGKDFRDRMFENSNKNNGDYIVAERKW